MSLGITKSRRLQIMLWLVLANEIVTNFVSFVIRSWPNNKISNVSLIYFYFRRAQNSSTKFHIWTTVSSNIPNRKSNQYRQKPKPWHSTRKARMLTTWCRPNNQHEHFTMNLRKEGKHCFGKLKTLLQWNLLWPVHVSFSRKKQR